ncbi:MAG: SAF domain-containing protein [Bdellovibrionales bacterium]|nr:SAF domain-containing protein [Bdellovibrionales bacterium]
MRVHPTVLRTSNNRWQFPVAAVLLLGLIATTLMRGSGSNADATANLELRSVVVVQTPLEAGKPITKEMLVRQNRPLMTLPSDFVTDWAEIEGRVSVGPVPSGYPLAKSLLILPKDLKASQQQPTEPKEPEKKSYFDEHFETIQKNTVAINIPFAAAAPPRVSRVALSLKGTTGPSVLIAEGVWVEATDRNSARLRVPSEAALFLEEAKGLGRFSYFVINEEGKSPFEGQSVSDLDELKIRMGLVTKKKKAEVKPVAKAESNRMRRRKFAGYAWVTGQGQKFSIGSDGELFVITEDGRAAPLHGFAAMDEPESAKAEKQATPDPKPFYSMFENEDESPETAVDDASPTNERRRVETGLEPFYPWAGVGKN